MVLALSLTHLFSSSTLHLKYRETVRETMFNTLKAFIDVLSNGPSCSRTDGSIKSDCRNALFAWIAYLQSISTRAAFEREIEKPTKFFSENCNEKRGESCFWLFVVRKSKLKITPSIALTDLLEEAQERK